MAYAQGAQLDGYPCPSTAHGPTIRTRAIIAGREVVADVKADPKSVPGLDRAVRKDSHLQADGQLRVDLIDGLHYRPARSVAHDAGFVTEIMRHTWDPADRPIVQVHATTTFPGRVRGWGLHRRTVDRLFVLSGAVRVVCYDGREGSPTYGRVNEFFLGDRSPGLVIIPTHVYHGWKNVGPTESIIISLPSEVYDHEQSDGVELAWDAPATRQIIPYDW